MNLGRLTIRSVAVLSLWLAAACSASPGADDQPEVSDVLLRLSIDRCNGVAHEGVLAALVAPGVAATVAHGFIDGNGELDVEEIAATDADGAVVEVELAYLDVERDVALLAVAGSRPHLELVPAAELDDEGRVRIAVFEGDSVIRRDVELQAVRPISLDGAGERQALELSGTVAKGDSGAPVLTDDDRVLGIVFASGSGRKVTWAIAAPEYEAAMAQPNSNVAVGC